MEALRRFLAGRRAAEPRRGVPRHDGQRRGCSASPERSAQASRPPCASARAGSPRRSESPGPSTSPRSRAVFASPTGSTIVPPREMRAWLAPLPVSNLWGAGPKTDRARCEALGLRDDRARWRRAIRAALERTLGALGQRFYLARATAMDPREVVGSRRARSVGSERTLNVDVVGARRHRGASARCGGHRGATACGARSGARAACASSSRRTDFRMLTRQRVARRSRPTSRPCCSPRADDVARRDRRRRPVPARRARGLRS